MLSGSLRRVSFMNPTKKATKTTKVQHKKKVKSLKGKAITQKNKKRYNNKKLVSKRNAKTVY